MQEENSGSNSSRSLRAVRSEHNLDMKEIEIDVDMNNVIGLDFNTRAWIEMELNTNGLIDLPIVMGSNIWIPLDLYIVIDLEMKDLIEIDIEIKVNEKELSTILATLEDKSEDKVQEVARYYYMNGNTVKQICDAMGIKKSQVYRYLNAFKADIWTDMKKDLKVNKKVTGHMVEALHRSDMTIKRAWLEYGKSALEVKYMEGVLAQEYEKKKENPNYNIKLKTVLSINSLLDKMRRTRNDCLNVYRNANKDTISILETYGLTGENAVKILLESGEDALAQFKTLRTTLFRISKVVQDNVVDDKVLVKIFEGISEEVKGIEEKYDIIDAEVV